MKFEREAKGILQRLKSIQEIVREVRYEDRATWLETTYTMEAERVVMKNTLLALNEK